MPEEFFFWKGLRLGFFFSLARSLARCLPPSLQVRELSQQVLKLKKQQQMARAAIAGAGLATQGDPKQTEKALKYAMKEAERIERELQTVRLAVALCFSLAR